MAIDVRFEENHLIEVEIRECPPATDPNCPRCDTPMAAQGNSAYLLWTCQNDDCPSTTKWRWYNGTLFRVRAEELD